MKKYQIIIFPSSENKAVMFKIKGDFPLAKRIAKLKTNIHQLDQLDYNIEGITFKEFESEKERASFILGYEAGVGWLGEGAYITNNTNQKTVDRDHEIGLVAAIIGYHYLNDICRECRNYFNTVSIISKLAIKFVDEFGEKDWDIAFEKQPKWLLEQICFDDFVVKWSKNKLFGID